MINKDALIRKLAADNDITLRQAKSLYEQVLGNIGSALGEGTAVRLSGFGTLKVLDVAARTVRNPRTGEPVDVPARKRVRFSASAALKRGVNA